MKKMKNLLLLKTLITHYHFQNYILIEIFKTIKFNKYNKFKKNIYKINKFKINIQHYKIKMINIKIKTKYKN